MFKVCLTAILLQDQSSPAGTLKRSIYWSNSLYVWKVVELTVRNVLWSAVFLERPSQSAAGTLYHGVGSLPSHARH